MKHLLFLERLDVGRTLALTVGSPSAHRRGTMLKHIAFMLLFLVVGVGQVWGEEATMTAGTNGSTATVSSKEAIKVGTSSKGGDMSITVGAGATKLTLYAAAWKGVTGLSLNITGATVSPASISLTADDGISNNSPFTLKGTESNFKFEITLSNITTETTIKFTSSTTKRFVVWGASYETSGSGSSNPTALAVPTGMSSGTPGMTSATLSWNPVEHADSYALTIGTGDPITTGFETVNNKITYTLSGLESETTYTWKVKATTTDTEHYSNSADCAAQEFETAADPTLLKVVYDFTKTGNYPSGFPTSSGTTLTNPTSFTFGSNSLILYSPSNYYRANYSSTYSLFFGQTANSNNKPSGAYIEFPARSGYKLTKVVVHENSQAGNGANLNIWSTDGTAMSTAIASDNIKDKDGTFVLNQSAYNTAYRLTAATQAGKNLRFDKITLTYAPKPAVSSIAIKTAPTKTTYTANENFDPSGLVITVNYEGGSSEDVTYSNTTASDFSFTPTTSTALNATNTSVTVTYGTKTANQAITVNRIATTLSWSLASYTANIGASYTFPTLTKTPEALEGVTFTSSNTDVVETISAAGVPTVKRTGTTTIKASFAQTNVYAAAEDASYTLTINSASSPSLDVDPNSVTFDLTAVGSNRTETVALLGEHLAANATYEIIGDDKEMFSIESPTFPLTPNEGGLLEDITIKYAPTAASVGSHTATLTITSGTASASVTLSGTAKNRRTVTWYKADNTELTVAELGSATLEVLDGDAVTVLPNGTALSPCDLAISFQGWTNATYAKNDDAPNPLYTALSQFPAISGNNASYYAVWAAASGDDGSVEITRNTTNFPESYGNDNTFTEYTLNGYKFKIQQIFNNSNATGTGAQTMQWRASGKSNGTGTIYNTDVFPGHISSIVIVYASYDTNKNIGLNIGDSENPTSGTSITPTNSGSTYTFDCSAYNFDYFVLTNGTGAGYTTSITINYAASIKDYATTCSAPVVIADPTFSPTAGSYNDNQNVTITAEDGMTIYYSVGAESNPKTSGTTYSSPISVTEDKVIKAVATDGNGNWSNIVTKTYTINYSSSIAAFIEKAQASTRALKLNAAQNCIITGIREYESSNTTKYDLYIQDASNKGIIVYGLTTLPEGAAEGKRIEGAISGTYALANGQHRITGANFTNATFNAAEALTPAAITAVDADAYNANPIMLVKLSGVYYNTDSYYFTSEAEGEGTSNYVYDSFKKFDGKTMPANTVACDITGILINYVSGNTSKPELLPLSLTTSATAVLPAISPVGGADAENAVEVTYMSTVSVPMVENEEVYISVNNADPALLTEDASVQIEGDVKLVVSAKRDFYADNTATYYYKPSAYPKQIAVTSAHGDVVVKVGDNTVSTALPDATVSFTVTPENEHFHIASTSVTYEGGSLTPALNDNVYSFTMPDKDATIVVNYTEDTHYTITYAAGGATSGSAPAGARTWQYAGENVELLANAYVWDENHNFTGWKVTYNEEELDKAVGETFEMPAANVTITAQWAEKQYCALTLKVNGADYLVKNIEQDVEQTISDLADYADPESQSGYEFVGWATSQEADDVTEAIATIESYTPQAGETSKTLYAVFSRVDVGTEKTDVLTAADMTATGTGYVEFSGVNKTSNAVYAGNSAKNGADAIQLRSKDSNSGIVSTTTGGVLQSVKINVASGSNTIDVYGSNTAYSAASDLYASATQGTKIGSTSSTTTINAAADYKYVGIRSNSGAIYLSSVEITWQPKTTYYTTAPSAVYAVSYDLGEGAWAGDACDGANVKAGQTFDICESVPVRDHYKFNGWTVGGNAVSGAITINAATAITAVWEAKVENNITYNAGTGTGDDAVVENNEEGAEIVLPSAAEKSLSKDGYDFVGWLYNDELYKAGQTFEMPASAVQFVAQWKKQNITKMTLVTDASQLVDGSKVVIAQAEITDDACKTMGAQGTNNRSAVASTVSGNVLSVGEGTSEFTLVSLGNNLFAFQASNGNYLYAASSGSNYLKEEETLDNNGKWTISIASNGVATIKAQGTNTHNWIQYNAPSSLFSCYGSGQKDIAIYASMTAITDNASISDLGYVEGDVIVVSSGATLTMDAPSAPASITVKENAVVNVSTATEAGTVIVEKGAKLAIEENGSVTTDEPLVLYTTLGKGTGTSTSGNAPGSSSEIINAERLNANGDVFLEIELTQEDKASAGWYAFSVPFPVDAMNGVYYGDTKLTNEVGYAIMSYHGDIRATGKYGWKKFRGIMQPGVLYVITVGNTDYKTLRFKKVADEALVASSSVAVSPFPTQTDNDADGAWNGIGNPNLAISNLSTSVPVMQFYDHKTNTFVGRNHSVNLVVGSAFFIQYDGGETVSIPVGTTSNNGYLAPQRERQMAEEMVYEVQLTNVATGELEDNVFLTAREDAMNSYEIGHDVAKMSMGTAKCAQMYVPAYGTNLCAADFQLVNDKAEYPLTITAPADGTYRIEAAEAYESATLYLTKDGRVMWNLSMSACEVELTKGTTENYGLLLVRKTPGVATEMENVQSDNVQCTKVIIDNQVFILRGGQMYDLTGKKIEK